MMGFFDWLTGLFQGQRDGDAYWLHVRCDQCQEVLRTRVDLAHDLSTRYDNSGRIDGYFTRKTLMGSSKCFNQVVVEVVFDARRRAMGHEVQGGQLISQQDFERALANSAAQQHEQAT